MSTEYKYGTAILLGTLMNLSITHHAIAGQGDAAGLVIMSVGQVSAQSGSGEERVLQRRSSIFEKDLIKTAAQSRIQIRLADGSLISLQENSSLKIESYSYQSTDNKADNAAYDLLKGGMRTISGAIGKNNRDEYKVATPVATIGIRGTDYELVLHDTPSGGKPKLYGYINDGVINVSNDGGNGDFGFNQFFVVAGLQQPPAQLLTPPQFMFEGFVPPQPKKSGIDETGSILLGETTGLGNLLSDPFTTLPDATNPTYTPFSTVSQLTGQYTYAFDSTLSGLLPTVQNGVAANHASSTFDVDFTSQLITYAYVDVGLVDGTTSLYAYYSGVGPFLLSDAISGGQPIPLTGTCFGTCVGGSVTPVDGTLGIQFVGNAAQGAIGSYQMSEAGITNGISVSGEAVYEQTPYQIPM